MTASAFPLGVLTGSLLNIQVFKSNGTYTPTTGTTKVLVKAIGAGGGGGSTNASNAGAAGGGGAYVEAFFSISGLTPATITIGAGGTGGAANNGSNGGNGTATSFGTTLVAAAGSGGQSGGGAAGAGGTIAGCTVPSGGYAIAGGIGQSFNTTSFTFGGASFGSVPNLDTSGVGKSGIANTGQGGAGGTSAVAGGGGGSGLMVIYEYS